MEAKKRLARTIVAGFHSSEAAQQADENWARQFQARDLSALVDEVRINWLDVVVADAVTLEKLKKDIGIEFPVYVAKLLVKLGMSESRAAGERQVDAGVEIDGVKRTERTIKTLRPTRITVRVGKRAKIAVIE